MAFTFTANAAKQIKNQLAKRGAGLALRIGVKQSGCSGFSYTYDYADEILAGDQVFEAYDAKIVLDSESFQYLDGSTLDFVTEGLKQTFKIENPKVTAMCGCGESFSINT